MRGSLTACSNRRCSSAIALSAVAERVIADGLGPTEGLIAAGLTAGEGDDDRSGVGMGVRMLRVSVAAAPGTGVGSGVSSVEHPAEIKATANTKRARTTLRV